MKSQNVDNHELSNQSGIRTYHTPQLLEWGDLQELTMGPGLGNQDFDGTGSRPPGKMVPTDIYNLPWKTIQPIEPIEPIQPNQPNRLNQP